MLKVMRCHKHVWQSLFVNQKNKGPLGTRLGQHLGGHSQLFQVENILAPAHHIKFESGRGMLFGVSGVYYYYYYYYYYSKCSSCLLSLYLASIIWRTLGVLMLLR